MRSVFLAALAALALGGSAAERVLRLPIFQEKGGARLTLGSEFPGAEGGLSFADGVGQLAYDLTKGGHYVGLTFPGKIDEGGLLLSLEIRGECPSDLTVMLRGEDAKKGDVHVQTVDLKPSGDWRTVTFDLRRFTGHYGRSTNAAERAITDWPLRNVTLVFEPKMRKTKGTFEVRSVRLTTTASKKLVPGWSASIGSERFGALYYPNETVELAYAINILEEGRLFAPPVVPQQVQVFDWRGRVVYAHGLTSCRGIVSLPPAAFGERFGAMKAVISGFDADSNECEIAACWFARLTGPNPKPVSWIGTGIHGWEPDMRRYDMMVAAGIGVIRNDALWRDCELKPGVYSEPAPHFLANIQALKVRGISRNIGLTHPNPVAYPDNPLDPDAHAAFCEHFAKTHPDVDVIEIFNEGWSFGFHKHYAGKWIEKLVEYNLKAVPRIRAVRPDAAILVASEDGWGALSREIQLGVAGKEDVVSFHPYIHGKDPRPEREGFFWRDGGKELRELLAAYGGATRLRITEVGWTTYGVDENGKSECWFVGGYPGVSYVAQAQYMIRAYLLARHVGVEAMMQYDFHDDGPQRNYTEHNFGMVFGDYTPKPSFAAVAFMARLIGEAMPLESRGDDAYRILGFRRVDGRVVYAMWAVEGTIKADLPPAAIGGDVYDLMGNRRRLPSDLKTIDLTERPCYVVCM